MQIIHTSFVFLLGSSQEVISKKGNDSFIWSFFFCFASVVQTHEPNLQKSAPTTPELQGSQTPSASNSCLAAVPERSSSDGNSQGGSSSSPSFSLTVCPTLKTPSFVEQSGTYRFRICPPTKQSSGGQDQRGIVLPGGFTLIQLPKRGADGAASKSENTENLTGGNEGALCGGPVLPGLESYIGACLGDRTEGSVSQESNVDFNFEGSSTTSFDMDEDVIVRTNNVLFFLKQSWITVNHRVMFSTGWVCGHWDRGRRGECIQELTVSPVQ